MCEVGMTDCSLCVTSSGPSWRYRVLRLALCIQEAWSGRRVSADEWLGYCFLLMKESFVFEHRRLVGGFSKEFDVVEVALNVGGLPRLQVERIKMCLLETPVARPLYGLGPVIHSVARPFHGHGPGEPSMACLFHGPEEPSIACPFHGHALLEPSVIFIMT
ncbi:hypothetical protein RRG08_053871 [Elysia crispata]|uniref:Uncharacterized protein n=1 Tax=Elysia crispata TaxID=231223 RepID=A0AAE1D1I4_9GAST|nr:hypothetical protein RRG08_053871 [Elysia crispata]